MYFVPLVAPIPLIWKSAPITSSRHGILSYDKKVTQKTFYVTANLKCREWLFHKYTFDAPEVIIATFRAEMKAGETLTQTPLIILSLKDEGMGRIEVKGTIDDSVKTVTEVKTHFNAGGLKSPVTIGLYDVEPENGQYNYEKERRVDRPR